MICFWPLSVCCSLFILPLKGTKITPFLPAFRCQNTAKHCSVLDSLLELSGQNVSLWNHVPGSLSDVTYLLLPRPCVGEEAFERAQRLKANTLLVHVTLKHSRTRATMISASESDCSRYFLTEWGRRAEGDPPHQMVFLVKCKH